VPRGAGAPEGAGGRGAGGHGVASLPGAVDVNLPLFLFSFF